MKQKDAQKTIVIVIVAMFLAAGGMFFALGGGTQSIMDRDAPTTDGPWRNSLVNYQLIFSDKYTGDDLEPTVKIYSERPNDWDNPRGSFDRASEFSIYTASDGEVLLNRHKPGDYYAVIQLAGHNTEFLEVSIPDGTGRGDLSDYQQFPDSEFVEMTQVGVLPTPINVEFAIDNNQNDRNFRHTELLTVADDTEFRGWRVIVVDEEGLRFDTSGDGTYDLGIHELSVRVGSQTVKLFEPDRGVDLFDSNGRYIFDISDVVGAQDDLEFRIDFRADVSTGSSGLGTLNQDQDIVEARIFDAEGSLVSTIEVGTAVAQS